MHPMPTTTTPGLPVLRSARVLLIDDSDDRAETIAAYLVGDDLDVLLAHSGEAAASRLRSGVADLVITRGAMLREVDRLRLAGMLPSSCPVIALCDGDAEDRTRALRRGCRDAMTTPVHAPELAERVRIALDGPLDFDRVEAIEIPGGLRMVQAATEATVNGQRVHLSAKEYALLVALARDPDRVFRKDELMREVWGHSGTTTRTLDSHACRLRSKLTEAGGQYIHNRWGVGYRLTPFH